MYTLQEIEQELGVKSYVIRFWENNFSQIGTTFADESERVYTDQDLEIFKLIQKYLYEEGLPIEEVSKRLDKSNLKTESKFKLKPAEEKITVPPEESEKEFLQEVKNKLDEILKILYSSK